MNVTIVDYQSGNISSVINSFTEVAKGKVNLEVTSDIKKIKSSDKIVLPGNTFMNPNYSKIENNKFNCQLFFLAGHFFHKFHFLDQYQL